jgi:hypothetical protein
MLRIPNELLTFTSMTTTSKLQHCWTALIPHANLIPRFSK